MKREATRLVRGAIDEVYHDIEFKNQKDKLFPFLLAEALLKLHSQSLKTTA